MDRKQIEAPDHYTQGEVEAWDVMRHNLCRTHDSWIDYLACTSYKYIHRAPYKGKHAEDYGKAIYCLQRAIDDMHNHDLDTANDRLRAAAEEWANEDAHSVPRGTQDPTWIAESGELERAYRNLRQQQSDMMNALPEVTEPSKYEQCYREAARRELFGETPDDRALAK